MTRAAAIILLVSVGCAKPQTNADSTAAGASAAATPTISPSDSARVSDSARSRTPATARAGDPVQREQTTPIQSGQTGTVIVGKVGEHGFDPVTFLAITPAGGAQTSVSGPNLEALRAARGAEVWARGEMVRSEFRVDTFEVRRANNQAVADGIVSVSGSTVTVRTSAGTLTYPDAPTALRAVAGSRVWITPPIKGQAPSFGVIRAKLQ